LPLDEVKNWIVAQIPNAFWKKKKAPALRKTEKGEKVLEEDSKQEKKK